MKTKFKFNLPALLAAASLLSGLIPATARADGADDQALLLADAEAEAPVREPRPPQLILDTTTSDAGAVGRKESIWLGVGVDEMTEALASQLGLKPGEGLVVSYVATNSPANAAGLRKYDVLVELDGQMLVDPGQLRKLVQMHAAGDSAKITFYRAGKKQSVEAKLVTKLKDELGFDGESFPGGLRKLQQNLRDLQGFSGGGGGGAGGSGDLNLIIHSAMDLARKSVQDALKLAADSAGAQGRLEKDEQGRLESLQQKLGDLAAGGVNVGKNATVVVKNEGESLRTVVKKDESGSYIVVADPRKHLTAHDADGKLLFDGAIETPADQEKVPKDVWKKVEPMLEDLKKGPPARGSSSDGFGGGGGIGGSGGGGGSQEN